MTALSNQALYSSSALPNDACRQATRSSFPESDWTRRGWLLQLGSRSIGWRHFDRTGSPRIRAVTEPGSPRRPRSLLALVQRPAGQARSTRNSTWLSTTSRQVDGQDTEPRARHPSDHPLASSATRTQHPLGSSHPPRAPHLVNNHRWHRRHPLRRHRRANTLLRQPGLAAIAVSRR